MSKLRRLFKESRDHNLNRIITNLYLKVSVIRLDSLNYFPLKQYKKLINKFSEGQVFFSVVHIRNFFFILVKSYQ